MRATNGSVCGYFMLRTWKHSGRQQGIQASGLNTSIRITVHRSRHVNKTMHIVSATVAPSRVPEDEKQEDHDQPSFQFQIEVAPAVWRLYNVIPGEASVRGKVM